MRFTSILAGLGVLENGAMAVQARSGSSFRFFRPAASEHALNDEAMRALAKVGLDDRASRRAGSLSHGEKRQLEIAIALATNAGLLLLDEPTAALDVSLQSRIIALLQELRASMGLSFLLITHNMSIVDDVADEVNAVLAGLDADDKDYARLQGWLEDLSVVKGGGVPGKF